MTSRNEITRAVRLALITSAIAASVPAFAQEEPATTLEEVTVTGSRIVRPDFEANSPITSVTAEQIVANADVTLDTFLNSLPQVNPAGTTTSNNPGNGGQSNIDLRGLGSNRNLVLIDGRRPMVSASDLTVDLNTIPAALIENIEVITGGAGAVYGADAIAGVVNIKTKRNFEGIDLRTSYSNHLEEWDAKEQTVSAVIGGNFADNRGNAVFGFDYSEREGVIKSQRPFSAIATSTTGAIPEGVIRFNNTNPFSQAGVDAIFARYGVPAGAVPINLTPVGINLDGTLFSIGQFNTPIDSRNFRYPIDLSVNTRYFPDFYSYNFDSVNILTLPLTRRSFMGKLNFEIGGGVETFAQFGYTEYDSVTAIAPTPMPTGTGTESLTGTSPTRPKSALVTPGSRVTGSLIVPATHPLIPADVRALLNTRTGDDTRLVGTGASEPFLMGQRTLPIGLRASEYNNVVSQYLLGFRGPLPFGNNWRWEAYASEGRTEIDQVQTGNVNAQRLQTLLEASDAGASICAGGYNPFGRNSLSAECIDYLEATSALTQNYQQQVVQGFVSGDLFEAPAGAVSLVVGAEWRGFDYELDPGAAGGAIYGFNTQTPAGGENSFMDYFAEAYVPLLKDAPFAQSLDVSLGYRRSNADFEDTISGARGDNASDSYKIEFGWQPVDWLRSRASYQRAVRAPNFGELFDGGGSAPQYFDPCQRGSAARGANLVGMTRLCTTTNLQGAQVSLGAFPNWVPLPGGQITIETTGNTDLKPETADTFTLGFVFQSPWGGAMEGFRASLDYYNIDISDAILTPDPNVLIAQCYNYYGTNPSYDPNYAPCQGIARSGGTIVFLSSPDDPVNGLYPGINAGTVKTDGIDLQLDYGIPFSTFGRESRLNANLLLNYTLSFKQQDRPELPTLEYAGTVSYFGQGLGTSFPELRANLNLGYIIGPFGANLRLRYIDGMENRANVQFPGETTFFTGVPSVTYVDLALSYDVFESTTVRIGVNNLTDKEPPLYAPNVQSGTDPSLYDVIGRRIFGQIAVKF